MIELTVLSEYMVQYLLIIIVLLLHLIQYTIVLHSEVNPTELEYSD